MTQVLSEQASIIPPSTFDLFEALSQEFQTLKESVLQFLQPPDPPLFTPEVKIVLYYFDPLGRCFKVSIKS